VHRAFVELAAELVEDGGYLRSRPTQIEETLFPDQKILAFHRVSIIIQALFNAIGKDGDVQQQSAKRC
jgi:hypothetical protein